MSKGYPLQQGSAYPQQPVYSQQTAYPQQPTHQSQQVYPPQSMGYPQQPAYPQQPMGYPQQAGYPPTNYGYPPNQGYPPGGPPPPYTTTANPYPQTYAPSTYPSSYPVVTSTVGNFDQSARFGAGASYNIPPPPPGVMPNSAQRANAQGQSVLMQQQKAGWFTGPPGGGVTFW